MLLRFAPLLLAALSFSTLVAAPEPTASTSANWKPIDTTDLYIQPGSALDFTPLFDRAPAGAHGRVIVNAQGQLAFASQPDVPVHFFSVQAAMPSDFYLWTEEEIVAYADSFARQGYNLVRIPSFDDLVCDNYRSAPLKAEKLGRYTLPDKPGDIHFNPGVLDRFQRLLAELKKRGIYWDIDFMASFVGYSNGNIPTVPLQGPYSTKVQMYVNPNFRANWKAAVTRLLNDVNPYTGLALKDDPALATTICLNEQEILFERRNYAHEFDAPWHAFLEKKYGTYAAMRTAWSGKCGDIPLPEPGTWKDVPPIAAPTVLADTPAGRDMAECCSRMETEMAQWYLTTLKELGFTGLSSNYNMRTRIGTVPARSLYPVITMNAYHAHPLFGAKTVVDQASGLSHGGDSFKNQALARFLDRPFVNTEFGIVFWNPYRHEQGLLYGAGAALQGWSSLNCHANQVTDGGTALLWFHAGDDPVIRASEVVTALAFRRGDVAASPHTIEIPLTDDFIYAGRSMRALDDELSRLWTLCRVGITYGPKKIDYPTVLSVSPDKTSSIGGSMWFSSVEQSSSTARLTAIIAKLREQKVLPAANVSDPAAGLLQSDTGEVTLNTRTGGELFVRTPRLEGAVLKRDQRTALDALTIEKCSVPASITVASIDSGKTLREAKRVLLVIATDARNTGMKFTDTKENTLVDIGTLPVLARTGTFAITLARAEMPKKVTAYALKLNGSRAEEIPVTIRDNSLALSVDTATLDKAGPTPFFELLIE